MFGMRLVEQCSLICGSGCKKLIARMVMNFPISFRIVPPEKGFPRRIKACIAKSENSQILSNWGTFKYCHFLRDLFEDLSKFQRISNLVFMKPGLEDLCISWTVLETLNTNELKESVIDGIENLNRLHGKKYRKKYNLTSSVPFTISNITQNGKDLFRINLKIDIQKSAGLSVVAVK